MQTGILAITAANLFKNGSPHLWDSPDMVKAQMIGRDLTSIESWRDRRLYPRLRFLQRVFREAGVIPYGRCFGYRQLR
jgi:hypothetical protein